MPTYIKTGYWDKKAKAPDGWLDLNLFCSTHGGGGTNIYNSDGTLTGNRQLIANNFLLQFQDINIFEINGPLLNNGRSFIIDNTNKIYQIGDIDGTFNRTFLEISDINSIIKTSWGSNDIGLKLDFANTTYQFGQLNGGNRTRLEIDDNQSQIVTRYGTGFRGIFMDFSVDEYQFGNNTGIRLYINNPNKLFQTFDYLTPNGVYCDFNGHSYQFGRYNGGNGTYLTITDAATYPLQLDGNNLLSATSGSTSGQHLKININGTDYVIELKNPS